jgi:hypothetical protein
VMPPTRHEWADRSWPPRRPISSSPTASYPGSLLVVSKIGPTARKSIGS